MAELKQKKRSSYRLNCGRLLAVHKSMSWNDRNCSTSVTFLFVVILNHIPASHTMYNLYFIYIYIVQYTCSHQRKKNSKSPPPPPVLFRNLVSIPCMFPLRLGEMLFITRNKYCTQANKCSDKLRGESCLDKAGVHSTFSTTLNKKSHANRHLLYGFDPVSNQKHQYRGKLKSVFC